MVISLMMSSRACGGERSLGNLGKGSSFPPFYFLVTLLKVGDLCSCEAKPPLPASFFRCSIVQFSLKLFLQPVLGWRVSQQGKTEEETKQKHKFSQCRWQTDKLQVTKRMQKFKGSKKYSHP
ncbi:hypothetical protein ILYODFUR_024104 [Ilyodon furcidens]|uniref:Uncharacterized protein n=1 Tax=Ilyodon furcidens TaxID=33524 RepID=A0ABV0ULK3_9TELE